MKDEKTGLYIIIEGDEGAGKTTQVELLADRLRRLDRQVQVVREPGGDPFGELMRLVLKADSSDTYYCELRDRFLMGVDVSIEPLTEAFAFFAARVNSRARVVQPKLKQGIDVLSDRGELSSLVYQGEAGSVDRAFLEYNCDFIARETPPTKTIVLDVSLEASQRRQADRGGMADRFESKGDFYRRQVNAGYRRLALEKGLPLIDGENYPEEVHEQIWGVVEPLL